jgi:hypothetical protein
MSEVQESTTAERQVSAQESCARIAAELGNLLRCLAPSEEVSGHFRTAHVEFLKGVRALIDSRIAQLSSGQQKGTSVPIE